MTILPEVHEQIQATAHRRALANARVAPGPRARWRKSRRLLGVAIPVLIVCGVLAVILVNAHHATNRPAPATPPHATPPPSGWAKLDMKAARQTQRSDPDCKPQRRKDGGNIAHGVPGVGLRSELAVLRHPAPVSQRVSAATLRHATRPGLRGFVWGIYIDYVRRVQQGAVTYYLVPAADINQTRPIPDRCYTEQLSALSHDAHTLPTPRRSAIVRYEKGQLQSRRAKARHPAGVCLFTIAPGVRGAGGCQDQPSLRNLTSLQTSGGGNNHETVTAVIVPNRVATITAHYSPQTRPGRVPHAITVTHRAKGNVVLFYLKGAFDPPSLTYRAANGTVLSTSN